MFGGVYLIYLVAQSNGRSIAISDAVWGLVLGEFAGMLVSLSFIGFGACKGANIRKNDMVSAYHVVSSDAQPPDA